MKTHVVETTCAVCGGKGMATPSGAASEWRGHMLIHNDPLICYENLQAERKRKSRQEKQSPSQPTEPPD